MSDLISVCYLTGVNSQQPFRDSPHNATSLLSGFVTLTCSVPDNPPVNILWQYINITSRTTITPSDRLTIAYNRSTGEGQLVITNLQYFDNGAYRCVAVYNNGTEVPSNASYITTIG